VKTSQKPDIISAYIKMHC